MSNQPGIIPLRPLTAGEVLGGAFAALRQNPAATLGMAATVTALTELIDVIALVLSRHSTGALQVVGLVGLVIRSVTTLALSAGLVVVVSQAVLGRQISMEQAWQRLRPHVGSVIGASVLVGLLCLLLAVTLIGIPAAVYFYVVFSFVAPVIVLEGRGVRDALSRSRALIRGAWLHTFGVLLLAAVVTTFISLTIGLVLAAAGLSGGGLTPGLVAGAGVGEIFRSATAAIIAGAVVAPVSAGVIALLYIDRRIRLERLDVELARAAAAPAPAGVS